jgi:hypothetical protein
MRYKTRKLIFPALAAPATAILISLLLTCTPLGPPDDYEEYEDVYTDVQYSPDGGSVTIYLDGSAPVRQSRALTKSLAILGHDLFEVVFYHPATNTVARTVWETGHAAGVSGVARNVNYAAATAYPTAPAGGNGAAILFVGKKSDRTLLAVGKLAAVDGDPLYSYNETTGVETPITPVPLITPTTKTVTFAVAALRAGVSSSAGSSSFQTDARVATSTDGGYGNVSAGNTFVANVIIGKRPFPLFNVDSQPKDGNLYGGPPTGGHYVHGRYRFDVVTNTTGNGTDFQSYYRNGILQKNVTHPNTVVGGDPPEVMTYPTWTDVENVTYDRIPRYPIGGGAYETVLWDAIQEYEGIDRNGVFPHQDPAANGTRVQAQNIAAANIPFNNPVEFLIGPTRTGMDGYVFAFSFQIPVYPLTNADSRASGFSWYLRPGYDPYRDDLDDGVGGSGGAILIGTGQLATAATSSIYIKKPPDKTKYQGAGTNPWLFTIAGIEIYRQTGGVVNLVDPAQCYFIIEGVMGPSPDGDIALEPNGNIQALLIANSNNGIVRLKVEYYGPPVVTGGSLPFIPSAPAYRVRNPAYSGEATIYETYFNIYYFNLPAGISFDVPDNHRYIITNSEDFNRFQNGTTGSNARPGLNGSTGGVFLVALFHNFNLGNIVLRAGYDHTIILVAGNPDIIIGKSGTNVFQNNRGATGTNSYYFGIWPFDEILAAEGMAFESQTFYINPGGTYQQVPLGANGKPSGVAPSQDAGYFVWGTGARTINQSGVTIFNEAARLNGPILP